MSAAAAQLRRGRSEGRTQTSVSRADAGTRSSGPGGADDLMPGVSVAIPAATGNGDGSLEAARVNVGRDGFVP